jgi:CRP/FNR family transcriptional regulator
VQTSSTRAKARKVFGECVLWAGAPSRAISRIFDVSTIEFHNTGSIALGAEACGEFLVVISGRVRASRKDARGHELSYARATAGEQIGAVSAMHNQPTGSAFVATEPSVVVRVPINALRQLMREEPSVSYQLALYFSQRFLELLETYAIQHADVHRRLAGHLISHTRLVASDGPMPDVIDLGMSRRELASVLGTVPETLSRAFGRLRDDNLIATEGRRNVSILDFDGLEAIAP